MKNYKVVSNDVMDFLKKKSYSCTGLYSDDMKNLKEIKDYPFDMSLISIEWLDFVGNKSYLQAKISAYEFIIVRNETLYGKTTKYEDDFSKQWQDLQLGRHQEEYLPYLTNWVAKKMGNLIKERDDKKSVLDEEKQKIENTYALEINFYKNYLLKLTNTQIKNK